MHRGIQARHRQQHTRRLALRRLLRQFILHRRSIVCMPPGFDLATRVCKLHSMRVHDSIHPDSQHRNLTASAELR